MKRNSRGFTLVEILIVVIILGILAAIVIPQFTNASNDARNNSVASTLQTLRGQVELYKIQHNDVPPPDAANFLSKMMNASNPAGATVATGSDATHTLGPYIQAAPVNPANGLSTVAADNTGGWKYTVNAGNQYTIQATNTANNGLLPY